MTSPSSREVLISVILSIYEGIFDNSITKQLFCWSVLNSYVKVYYLFHFYNSNGKFTISLKDFKYLIFERDGPFSAITQ